MDLPTDLNAARRQCAAALEAALADGLTRLQVDLRFEGLRWPTVAHGLCQALQQRENRGTVVLAFADMGAAALARRDFDRSAAAAVTFADLASGRCPANAPLYMAVTPTAPDFTAFETACTALGERPVIVLNPRLEDAAVGIGSIARARRRGFLARWHLVYGLYPLEQAALAYAHPGPWQLFREDPDGFRLMASLPQRPDGSAMDQLLGQDRLAGGLARATDDLLQQMG
ncbi:DUF1995 family protein [Candidatus Synechococcus spongiarum]|uniref:All3116 protein n=1 Tax=Candidatus Synechococcus spongiarum TaxID=431041 RepID=A0A171DGI0_9SYNE|nr:DUF1995 family protein [Candidatus Synechococcus spongiarum]SAY38804.1 All3116 protein [Candidatus Synechococcus spongiarum]